MTAIDMVRGDGDVQGSEKPDSNEGEEKKRRCSVAASDGEGRWNGVVVMVVVRPSAKEWGGCVEVRYSQSRPKTGSSGVVSSGERVVEAATSLCRNVRSPFARPGFVHLQRRSLLQVLMRIMQLLIILCCYCR